MRCKNMARTSKGRRWALEEMGEGGDGRGRRWAREERGEGGRKNDLVIGQT